jgi:hypothetical protein
MLNLITAAINSVLLNISIFVTDPNQTFVVKARRLRQEWDPCRAPPK